jgi:subtilisin family serine protease
MRGLQKLRRRALLVCLTGAVVVVAGAAAAAGRNGSGHPLFAQGYAAGFSREQARGIVNYASAWPKLDSRLAEVASGGGLLRASQGGRLRSAGLLYSKDGRVRVVVEAGRRVEAQKAVVRLGGRLEGSYGRLVQAMVPPGALSQLSLQPSVRFVRPPLQKIEQSVAGEEVAASLAPPWHAKGLTGKGVKVAVIDGGFEGLSQRQAEGELPSNVVTADYCRGHFADATEHGTAVAEIVHEMAPDAQLYLVCIETEVDLANAEAFVKAQGVQIVNHSVGWFNSGRGDGSGPIGAIVQDARSSGILWVNAAGNEAETHWSGTFSSTDGDSWHNFAPSDEGNSFVLPSGASICGLMKWDQWPAAQADFALALALSGSNEILDMSDTVQSGSQPPTEEVCGTWTGPTVVAYWAIYANQATGNPKIDLFSITPPLQYETAAGSVIDPATSPAALAVGALCWQTNALEFYSSQGPTIDGRVKPDLAGHDSVSGATYGPFSSCVYSAFAGTSAASPEVAGAAALVKGAFPAYGPDQLQKYLNDSAKDVGAAGPDDATGVGMLQLPASPDVVAPVARALRSTGKRGKIVRLLSQASDDSGQVRVLEQVFRNGRLVATLRTPFAVTKAPKTFVTGWKSPRNAKGAFKHCSKATDQSGNTSATSCAPIALR